MYESLVPRPISLIGQNKEFSSSIVSSRSVPMRQHPTKANDGRFLPTRLFVFYQNKKNTSFSSSGATMPSPKNHLSTNKSTSLSLRHTHPHSQHIRDSSGVVRFRELLITSQNSPKKQSNGKKSLHYPDFLYNDAEILLIVFYFYEKRHSSKVFC